MNFVVLMGRLTNEPDVRYEQGGKAIARYTLAVDRRGKEKSTDFIRCVAFDNVAQWVEKYLAKGTKIGVTGKIRTGSYTDREGKKVFTTDVIVDNHYFCESKAQDGNDKALNGSGNGNTQDNVNDGFMPVSNAFEGLPF